MTYQLLESILESGINNSHFFNGRILTADALRADQIAQRQQRQQLGQAIGTGIVRGLTVQHLAGSDPPTLRITSGLANNAQGQVLELPQNVDLALARERDTTDAAGGLFVVCQPLDTGEYVTGRNVYILALAPASGYREQAPLYDLSSNGNGRAPGCGFRYATEGVQFRLVEVNLDDEDVISGAEKTAVEALIDAEPQTAATVSHLRNFLAHLCLGTSDAVSFPSDLYTYVVPGLNEPDYGLLARITDPKPEQADEYTLGPCDVPLALLYWTTAGVQFVDMWSVRRRVIRPASTSDSIPFVSDKRLAEGEAGYLQFQAQIAYLSRQEVPQATLDSIKASDYFAYLPAAGVIPLTGMGSARGFDYDMFFQGLSVREPIYVEGARVSWLLRQSFVVPPIYISGPESTFMWLYLTRENQQALTTGGGTSAQSYLVYSSGYLPFIGDARYDLNRYENSNYGIIDRNEGFLF